jgi:hypothetical protein
VVHAAAFRFRLTPSAVPLSPALHGTDERIRSSSEASRTFDALALDTRVQFAIGGTTFGVHAFPVSIAPVPRRRTMAYPATRRDTEMHPAVARELLERKPLTAPRALLLRHGLNAGHCVPPFRVGVSFANSWTGIYEPHCLRRPPPPEGLPLVRPRRHHPLRIHHVDPQNLAWSDAFRRKPSAGRVTARTGAVTGSAAG